MKIGDKVRIIDGSFSVELDPVNGFPQRAYGVMLKASVYRIRAIAQGLPSISDDVRKNGRELEYENDVLLQDVNNPDHLVYSRLKYIRPEPPPPPEPTDYTIPMSHQAAIKIMLALDINPFIYAKQCNELASLLRQPPSHWRDSALVYWQADTFAGCRAYPHRE
jgi:hypothetical protein